MGATVSSGRLTTQLRTMLKGNPSGQFNTPAPVSTAKIINLVAGRLPLSAKRPAHPETLVSQGPIAKPQPRPLKDVRSSEADARGALDLAPATAASMIRTDRLHNCPAGPRTLPGGPGMTRGAAGDRKEFIEDRGRAVAT